MKSKKKLVEKDVKETKTRKFYFFVAFILVFGMLLALLCIISDKVSNSNYEGENRVNDVKEVKEVKEESSSNDYIYGSNSSYMPLASLIENNMMNWITIMIGLTIGIQFILIIFKHIRI